MKVSLYLKTYRTTQHLTQKEMAYKIGVSREYYSRLEHGIGNPSVDLLERICSSTGSLLERLFKRKDGATLDSDLAEMCELCVMLQEKDRKNVLSLIKKLMEK